MPIRAMVGGAGHEMVRIMCGTAVLGALISTDFPTAITGLPMQVMIVLGRFGGGMLSVIENPTGA
jgi:hypothetical protein